MKVINDLHIGTQRRSGTTPASQEALRGFVLKHLQQLFDYSERVILVNGDLFDGYNVPAGDVLATYKIMANWLTKQDCKLILAAGNHDLSRDSTRLSSFELLGSLLCATYPDQVTMVLQPTTLHNVHIIPHCANQELFDEALAAAPSDVPFVFVHANFASPFAIHSDHSLNVSFEQAKVFTDRAQTLVFGHEHQQKELPGIVIVGNQFPTSISDCLGNSYKQCLIVQPVSGKYEYVKTWEAAGSYAEVDWRDLQDAAPDLQFVRVSGTAAAVEASDAVSAIARFRQQHSAFVISNAVNVEREDESGEFRDSLEDVKGFDILSFLLDSLTVEQQEKVKELLRD